MSFVISLAWLKRGVAKTPSKLKIDKEELEQIIKSTKNKTEENEDVIEENEEEFDDVNEKYKLDDYDNEGFLTKH